MDAPEMLISEVYETNGNYYLILSQATENTAAMKTNKIIFWVFAVIIFIQSFAPINGVNSKMNNTFIFEIRLDYLVHAAMFACLSYLFRRAYFPEPNQGIYKTVLFLGIMFTVAFCSEAAQWIVAYRVFNINDLVANFLGVILSFILYQSFLSIKSRNNFFNQA